MEIYNITTKEIQTIKDNEDIPEGYSNIGFLGSSFNKISRNRERMNDLKCQDHLSIRAIRAILTSDKPDQKDIDKLKEIEDTVKSIREEIE